MKPLRETVVCVLCVFPLTAVEADPDEKQLCVFPLTAVEADTDDPNPNPNPNPNEKQLYVILSTVVLEVGDEPQENHA